MGLSVCPSCKKINKTTRDNCWSCSTPLNMRRNPDDEWAGGTFAYRRNPSLDSNTEGDDMRSMKRYNRNPSWGSYLGSNSLTSRYKRRNPDNLWFPNRNPEDLWFPNRSRNPENLWFPNRHRNPANQGPVWGSPSWGNGGGVWGKTLFRNRRNPGQAPVWGSPSWGNGAGVWGKNLFGPGRRNPGGQAPVWGSPSWGNGAGVWGKNLFGPGRRNPTERFDEVDFSDLSDDLEGSAGECDTCDGDLTNCVDCGSDNACENCGCGRCERNEVGLVPSSRRNPIDSVWDEGLTDEDSWDDDDSDDRSIGDIVEDNWDEDVDFSSDGMSSRRGMRRYRRN